MLGLVLASSRQCLLEREKKHLVSLKGRPQDRFVYSTEGETFAVAMAREWVYKLIK